MSSHIQDEVIIRHSDLSTARRMPFKVRSAYFVARCAQNVWILLAATPVIVVICAIRG